MNNDEKLQTMLDNFIRRDEQAVSEFNMYGIGSIEAKVAFLDGRLRDVCAICMALLKDRLERSNG